MPVFADGPIIKSVGPDKLTTAPLYSSTSFACSADGNPPPKYQWLQRVPNPNGGPHETVVMRSSDPKLHFTNITYDFQGEYVCVVANVIGGSERSIQSQPITLQVIGKWMRRRFFREVNLLRAREWKIFRLVSKRDEEKKEALEMRQLAHWTPKIVN